LSPLFNGWEQILLTYCYEVFMFLLRFKKQGGLLVTVGQIIKQKRTLQSLSVQKLADILCIDRSLLSRYETGKRNVSKNHAEIIESYLKGDYDQEILNSLLNDLKQKYAHLEGKRGLELWEC
jgi:transcriptional regulator with XRE-family HTH domain